MTLASGEFIRRFLIHVLPSGFHRIRHYGLFANGGRAENLARARELLGVSPTQSEPRDTDAMRRAADTLAPMPVLRWPHDHHRDLRARLHAAEPDRRARSGSTHHDAAPDSTTPKRCSPVPLVLDRRGRRSRSKPHRRTLLRCHSDMLRSLKVPRLGPSSSRHRAPHAAQARPIEPAGPQLPAPLSP